MRSHPTLSEHPAHTVHSAARSTSPGQTHRSEVEEAPGGAVLEPATQQTTLGSSPRGPRTPRGAPNSRPGPWAAARKRPARPRRPAGFPATRRHLQTRAPLRAARDPAFPRGASAARAALPAGPPRPARRPNFSRPGPEGAAVSAEPSRPPARTTRGAPVPSTRKRKPRSEPRGPRSPRAHLPPPRTAGYVAGAAACPPRLCSRLAGGSRARDRGSRRPLPPGSRILLSNPNAGPGHAAPCTLRTPGRPGCLAREAARPEGPCVSEPVWEVAVWVAKAKCFLACSTANRPGALRCASAIVEGRREGLGSPFLKMGIRFSMTVLSPPCQADCDQRHWLPHEVTFEELCSGSS